MINEKNSESETEALKNAKHFTNFRIIKNVSLLSFSFLLICTSVDGLQMLQSTLNRGEGIGVVSIAIQFAFGCITALFFMKYTILKIGTKWTLTFCILVHIPSTVANFYPHWITMIPSYAVLGIAATLLWGSNSAYLSDISNKYADNFKKTNVSIEKEYSHQNNYELNKEDVTSGDSCTNNFKSSNDGHEIDCSKFTTGLEQPISSYISINYCDKIKIVKNAKTKAAEDKSITSLNKTNKMPTVFELANATIEAITSSDKLNNTSSATNSMDKSVNDSYVKKPVFKSNFSSSKTNYANKLDNATSTTNPKDNLDSVFEFTNPIDKVDSANFATNPIDNNLSARNPVDKFDSAYSTINPTIEVRSTDKVYHDSKQASFVSFLVESTTARFFGIHSMFYQSGHIWSNIVSFYVLQRGVVNDTYIHDSSCMCGANFCNIESECFESNLKEPSKEVKYLLISIFLALNILAVLLTAIFLDPLESRKNTVHYSVDFAMATFNQLRRPLQLLIVPLSIYMGMTQGFFYADFPKAFIGCAWGMHHVGLVTITFGITGSAASTLSGWLVKHLGRRTIFLIAAVINVAVNIIMLLWTPDSNKPIMFFVIAGMWGVLMGSFWSQLKAFHGVLFKSNEAAAFGCYELSHSIGACVSFACSNYLCLYVKIYMLLFVSSIGMIGYLIAEQIRPGNI